MISYGAGTTLLPKDKFGKQFFNSDIYISGIYLPFWSPSQGPVEFGKISFEPSNWEFSCSLKNWTAISNGLKN